MQLFRPLKHRERVVHTNAVHLINPKPFQLGVVLLITGQMGAAAGWGKRTWQSDYDYALAIENLSTGDIFPNERVLASY